jgi:hypothetical protein
VRYFFPLFRRSRGMWVIEPYTGRRKSFSPSSTNQTGIEIVFPDFLPITVNLISRYRERRSLASDELATSPMCCHLPAIGKPSFEGDLSAYEGHQVRPLLPAFLGGNS